MYQPQNSNQKSSQLHQSYKFPLNSNELLAWYRRHNDHLLLESIWMKNGVRNTFLELRKSLPPFSQIKIKCRSESLQIGSKYFRHKVHLQHKSFKNGIFSVHRCTTMEPYLRCHFTVCATLQFQRNWRIAKKCYRKSDLKQQCNTPTHNREK